MTEHELTFKIPWPPSINKLYVNNNKETIASIGYKKPKGRFLTQEGRRYKKSVSELIYYSSIGKRFGDKDVELQIIQYPPDNRIRDKDNGLKIVFDCLQQSTIIDNDSQVACYHVLSGPVRKPGYWVVQIKPFLPFDYSATLDMIDEKLDTLNHRSLT